MADMVADSETGTSHQDMRSAEKQRGERLVNATVTTVENFLNPFDMADKDCLVCISSGM